MEKRCSICGVEKDLSEFYGFKNKNGKISIKSECKRCFLDTCKRKYIPRDRVYKKRGKYNIKKRISMNTKNFLKKEKSKIKALEFVNRIEKQKGFITEIDAFILTSLYVDLYGIFYDYRFSQEQELLYYWEKLKMIKNEF